VTVIARRLGFLIALLLALAQSSPALAHASLIRAEPGDGAMLAQAPATLRLTFNEPVSPLVMRLVAPSGEVISPQIAAENNTVTLTPPQLSRGSYVLSWRVISADGHPVGGSLLFSIGAPSAQPMPLAAEGDAAVHAALWAAKVILYLGLFVGIGGVFFGAWIAERGTDGTTRWLLPIMVAGLVATAISVGLQGLDALDLPLLMLSQGAVWRTGFDTSYGSTALVATCALLAGLFATATRSRRAAQGLSLVALLGVGLALALSGHAATAQPRLITSPSVFLHGICVTFWIGALLPLFAALRAQAPDRALARFSRVIPYPLTVLVITGVTLAVVQLDRVDALWTTRYGIVLACKLVAVDALLILAAVNRYALVPRFEATRAAPARPLRASIAVELAIAVVILGLVASWRFTPPPRSLALAGPQVSIHFHGQRAMAQIEVVPVRGRGAHLGLEILDGELRPLTAKEVALVLSNPAAGIEPVRRAAVSEGGPQWSLDDLRIPIAGRWRLRVEILIDDFDKVVLEDDVDLPRSP
jgi:copper transport protein